MQDSDLPIKFPIPWANGAGGSFIRPIPQASQIGIQNGAASLIDGFPPNCFLPIASGGSWPWAQDFNGILNQITKWSRWYQAGAPIGYDATYQSAIGGYPKGTVVSSATTFGLKWLSTVDNNASNPDTGGANWIRYPIYGQQSFTASGNLTVPDYVTLLKRARLWGAGGGSGGTLGAASASTGGAAGGYAESVNLVVTPGQVIPVTIGVGGPGGNQTPTNGSGGGASGFLSLVATGGGGGLGANGIVAGGPYPIPGSGSGGNVLNLTGGNMSGPAALGGGAVFASAGGMAPIIGVWQNPGATSVSVAGSPGAFPGGGASGSACQQNGAAGAGGLLLVEW